MATNVQGIVQPPKVTEPVDPYAATGVPVAPKPPVAPTPGTTSTPVTGFTEGLQMAPPTGGPGGTLTNPTFNGKPGIQFGGGSATPGTPGYIPNSPGGIGDLGYGPNGSPNRGLQNQPPTGNGTVIGSVGSPTGAPPASPAATSATAPAAAPAAPPAVTGSLPTGVGTSSFGPGNTLIGQQITTAGDPSRIDLAKQYFDQMSQATDPAYAASLRKATQVAAANGGLGSGQLNTSYGDLALQRAQNLDLLQRGLLTNATEGTISDNLNNANQARTERSYQNDLQNQALQQRLQQLMLEQQIGGNQAGYLGSYNANPNITASQSYGKTTSDQSNALQQMLAASQQLSGLIPSSPPAPPPSMPNIPNYTFDPVTGQIIVPPSGG